MMWSKIVSLFKKEVKQVEQVVVSEILYVEPTILKPLKWVTHQGRIAIVTDLSSAGTAVIHLVNSIGETVSEERVAVGELMLAKHLEIPEARRPADPTISAGLGYM